MSSKGNQRSEVCRSGSSGSGIRRESSLVNSAFMSKEGSNPGSHQNISKFYLRNAYQSPVTPSRSIGLLSAPVSLLSLTSWADPTFASRNHIIFLLPDKARKAKMCNRSRVAMAGQGYILLGDFLRCHGCSSQQGLLCLRRLLKKDLDAIACEKANRIVDDMLYLERKTVGMVARRSFAVNVQVVGKVEGNSFQGRKVVTDC